MPTASTPAPSTAGRPGSMGARKHIALIAHDNRKADLLDWARYNRDTLSQHELSATGTTGSLLARELDLPVTCYRSGPLGGDQQIGAAIVEGRVDVVVFFSDPLEPHPHDPDVKALLRIAVVYNIPIARNRAMADFVFASPLLGRPCDAFRADPGTVANRWPLHFEGRRYRQLRKQRLPPRTTPAIARSRCSPPCPFVRCRKIIVLLRMPEKPLATDGRMRL